MTIAPHRIGAPQPLAQHIGQMLAAYQAGLASAAGADRPDFPWAEGLAGSVMTPPEPVALASEIADRMARTMDGLQRWQAHPFRRAPCAAPIIWQSGSSSLLDYTQPSTPPDAPAVLVLPSLVNRSYVLDLLPGYSAMARLSRAGLRAYLLDWGAPGADEAAFGLADYIARARQAVAEIGPASLLGYCMGGTLAAGLAARYPQGITGLVALGAPWDFSTGGGIRAQLRLAFSQQGGLAAQTLLTGLAAQYGTVPHDLFQSLFALLNPLVFARKFRRFAQMPDGSAEALLFVALEDWLADGIPMAGPAAKALLLDWHLHNASARGEWMLNGQAVDPTNISCPSLIIAGAHDTIAPAASALALAKALPGAMQYLAPTGHVGLLTSASAAPAVWQHITTFLRDIHSR